MKAKIFLSCLLLCLAYANTYAQQPITISGSVMNQNGEPLQGAMVVQTKIIKQVYINNLVKLDM